MNRNLRKIREALRLSQTEFGRRIGRSLPSIQAYEAGKQISPPAEKAIIKLAQQAGLGDLVDDFLADREEAELAPGLPIVGRPSVKTARLHDLLDEVLRDGDDQAILAVTTNLRAFARQTRSLKRGD